MNKKLTTLDIEIAVAAYFRPRYNLCVPNVSWGLGLQHEADLLIVTPSLTGIEVEIKVDKYDLRKDAAKPHQHSDPRIQYLYFAIPWYMMWEWETVPEWAGIMLVGHPAGVRKLWVPRDNLCAGYWTDAGESNSFITVARKPQKRHKGKFSRGEYWRLLELLSMRIWTVKAWQRQIEQGIIV